MLDIRKLSTLALAGTVALAWACGAGNAGTTASVASSSPATSGPGASPDCSTVIRAGDFAASCTNDSECVAVYEGPVSASCRCAYAAISRSDLPRYEAAIHAHDACHDPQACGADCIAVTGNPAVCKGGTCAYVERGR